METVDFIDEAEQDKIKETKTKKGARTALITDAEILALLEQPGIDIEALTSTYPELDREYILELKRSTRERRDGGNADKKGGKNRRKKRKSKFETEMEEEEEDVERFMKQFTSFDRDRGGRNRRA